MTAETRVEGQQLLVVRIHGVLRRAELERCQRVAEEMLRAGGTISVLVQLEGFKGWERTEEWGDMLFFYEHDGDIEKIAVVGEERWREEVLLFAGAGLRQSPVRYFNDDASARRWLVEI